MLCAKESCTGCLACYQVCPTGAITYRADEEGFQIPFISIEKCINCTLCERSCPIINPVSKQEPRFSRKIYAAWSNDKEIRMTSTSGGVFSELAVYVLNNSGYVFGVAYDKDFMPVYEMIDSENQLSKLRQSKYVEAASDQEFIKAKRVLDLGKEVLFVGTPCKIAGLYAFLNKPYDNLITCDFICRGINSPLAYKKYLTELEEQYQSKITKVWFKNKKNGWNQFGTEIEFENGNTYFKDRYHDAFMQGYLFHNLYLRNSCTDCKYKDATRVSDLTLADFWGVELPEGIDMESGISMVITNTKKGELLFSKISSKVEKYESSFEKAFLKNPCANQSINHGEKRDYFFETLSLKDQFSNIIKKL